jgi:mutator protein MutT
MTRPMAKSGVTTSSPRESPPQEPVRGAVAVIRRGGRYLLIRRARDLAAGGAWCFPGGAIEEGEASREAIVREVAEEVGLPGVAVEQVWQSKRPDGGLILDWWRVEPLNDLIVPNPAEVAEFRWLTAREIRNTPGVLPGLLEFLDHFSNGH